MIARRCLLSICALELLLAGCRRSSGAPAYAVTPTAPAAQVLQADSAPVYPAVIRRIYARDDSFGGSLTPDILYIVGTTDDSVGDPDAPQSAAVVLPATLRKEIGAALADLPARLTWVDSAQGAPRGCFA